MLHILRLIAMGWILTLPTHSVAQKVPQSFQFTIEDNKLVNVDKVPLRMRVKHHDKVEWSITSNNAGELHLHAYGIEVKVPKNKTVKYRFDAKATGKFQIEWHPELKANTTNTYSHHAPLAYFEVYPE